ncbi:uncharacterized protein LOC129722916 [Wyeomyia smithii]|uniref:uncharacterized protein LOC129722916 n=1 Tax=Wyeomyia smithii TaxID=174621 RepID=UPI002467C4DC|nr:uncharacterized protein LOC129722916 [Wyeomyia smithii]
MEKRDNYRKTGTGGGSEYKTNDIDILVYDILGKEVLEGLVIPESMEELAEEEFFEKENRNTSKVSATQSIKKPLPKKRKIDHSNGAAENADLARRKLQLTIDVLERERELKSLEIEKMTNESHLMSLKIFGYERSYGFPASNFTQTLGNTDLRIPRESLDEPIQEEYLVQSITPDTEPDDQSDANMYDHVLTM